MNHIQQMIDQHGGFEAVRTRYLRLENPPLMRLVIEVLHGPYPNGAYEVSVAHYAEQNGDAMRDPEITFLVVPAEQGTTWTPLTFENSYLACYQVVAGVSSAGLIEPREPALMGDLRDFADQWDRNLMQQGFMTVFERQHGAQNGATHAATVTNYAYQDGGRTVIEKDGANAVLRTTRQMLDGQTLSIEGGAVVAEYHDYAVAAGGTLTETVHFGSVGGAMYRKRVTNGLGQLVQEVASGAGGGEKVTDYTYDDHGRLTRVSSSSSAPVQTLYDAYGRAVVQRVLMNGTASGNDPLTMRTVSYQTQDDSLWEVTTTRQAVDGDSTHDLVSVSKRRVGGAEQVETSQTADGALITQTTTVNRATATVTTTMVSNRATQAATRIAVNGLLQSETGFTATNATTYTYDGLERLSTVTTPEGITRQSVYDDDGNTARSRVKEEKLIPAGGGTAITQAVYSYNSKGQVSTVAHADNTTTTSTYDLQGRQLTQGGTAGYPLRYEYDALGRLWKLHTYRDTQSDDVTTWNYDPASGTLLSKTDAMNRSVSYTYDVAGRQLTRTWQRGVVTTYSYDGVGRLTSISYNDGTPGVSHAYDRAGRKVSTTDAAGTHAFTYDAASGGQLATWSVGGNGVWSGLSVTNTYTSGQRSSRATSLGGISLPTVGYTYEAASGRMASVSADGVTATYRYNAATGWNDGVTYNGGLSSTRAMDALGRLDAITWSVGGNVVSGHDYSINAMNRRTAAQRQDGSKWNYGYNDRGEVTSAAKEDAIGIPEPGKQYGFAFDGLGNRTSSTVSSLPDNQTVRTTSYTSNALNQYEQINHPQPGWLVLRGSVNAAASVTIDNEPPTVRFGPLWHYEKSVDNSDGAKRRIAEIIATRPDGGRNNGPVTTKRKGATFIPPPVESPTYDLDGNQTSDARWTYFWDAENRMVLAEEKNIAVSVAAGVSMPTTTTRHRVENTYDSMNRRLTKKVWTLTTDNSSPSTGTWVLTQSLVFLYDQWNMIAEIGSESSSSASVPLAAPALLRSYEWGLDVSGTMDGAGGVGGQLIQRHHPGSSIQQPASGAHAPCFDGNGNITELVNLTTNTLSARYEYGPFGETISVDGGAVAEANPFRFSTKYLDVETGLMDYGRRFYDAPNGRWRSWDPFGINGGINLYGFCANDGINRLDILGEKSLKELISNGVTSAADKAAAAFQQAADFANNNPWALDSANAIIDAAKPILSSMVDQNEQSMGWIDLGCVWLFELGGKDHWQYDEKARTTNDLFTEDGVREARKLALAEIAKGCPSKKPIEKQWTYGQQEFYKGVRTLDLTTSFTGSYHVKIDANCEKCELEITVTNTTGWASGTRLRKAATPGGQHQEIIPDRKRGDPGLHLGGTIDEEWKWKESVSQAQRRQR